MAIEHIYLTEFLSERMKTKSYHAEGFPNISNFQEMDCRLSFSRVHVHEQIDMETSAIRVTV